MFCFFGFVISALIFLWHWATVTLVILGRALGVWGLVILLVWGLVSYFNCGLIFILACSGERIN